MVGDRSEWASSEAWIAERLTQLAAANHKYFDSVKFENDPRGFGEFLVVRWGERRKTLNVWAVTLDDLAHDPAEQTHMSDRLRGLISELFA